MSILFLYTYTHSHDTVSGVFQCLLYIIIPGNTKRGIYILQNAIEVGAKPKELLEAALQKMQAGKTTLLCSEDKENVPREYLFMFTWIYRRSP